MVLKPKYIHFSFLMFILLLALSCSQNKKEQSDDSQVQEQTNMADDLATVISLDTLNTQAIKAHVDAKITYLQNVESAQAMAYLNYFIGKKYLLDKKRDSAQLMFEKIVVPKNDNDVLFLKKVSLLDLSVKNGVAVKASLMDSILTLTERAEEENSRITYRCYDLLAQAYYQNHNEKISLQYVEKYFANHPFKNHPVIKQRYYDVSFLLASRMNDYDKMQNCNAEARKLAVEIKDSMAIARTYDSEAQIYERKKDYPKALAYSKIYVQYLLKTNNINSEAYNNLATSFIRNSMLDSAINYYKKAIELDQKESPGKQKFIYYIGLLDAYKLKGDYKLALQASRQAHALELSAISEIEAIKVAEIREKYEAEKKDKNIIELQSVNQLNKNVIKQQKTTIIVSSLAFLAVILSLYFSYKQRQLKQKNSLLQSDNKRLNMEQKLLQVQLNPHFIFNSIANLQSLASASDTKETVRYLNVFSGLLRNILEQSRKDFITLEEEVATLENYIQLQQMRYHELFDYQITTAENIYLPTVIIPPMLIQPFIENAIEHGFRNIDYKGQLNVSFNVVNDQLIIVVDDNGKGIEPKNRSKQKKNSLAGTILRERLDVVFNSQGQEAKYEQTDKKEFGDHGYIVKITIPELKD